MPYRLARKIAVGEFTSGDCLLRFKASELSVVTPKYFYVEDDTAVLFAANGTALTALLVGISDVVPLLKSEMPTYPMWIYFIGLIFAFFAKMMIQLINGDIRQREKLQHARDFIIETRVNPEIDEALIAQLDESWRLTDLQYAKLLKQHHGPTIDKARAAFFLASAVCFLLATASLIDLAGKLKA